MDGRVPGGTPLSRAYGRSGGGRRAWRDPHRLPLAAHFGIDLLPTAAGCDDIGHGDRRSTVGAMVPLVTRPMRSTARVGDDAPRAPAHARARRDRCVVAAALRRAARRCVARPDSRRPGRHPGDAPSGSPRRGWPRSPWWSRRCPGRTGTGPPRAAACRARRGRGLDLRMAQEEAGQRLGGSAARRSRTHPRRCIRSGSRNTRRQRARCCSGHEREACSTPGASALPAPRRRAGPAARAAPGPAWCGPAAITDVALR